MRNLTIVTLLYITLPTYFFLFFWVNSNYSIISMVTLTFVLFFSIYKTREKNLDPGSLPFSLKPILRSSFFISLALSYFSEFGGFNYQSYDYQAHNFKFNLLATQPLPLYDQDRDVYMCYYLGYYIVPSLLGKITSIHFIKGFAFIWTWFGLLLSFSWIQIRFKDLKNRQRIMISLLIIFGSYVSVLLPALSKLFSGTVNFQNNSILINGKFVLNQLPIFSKSLSEAPQHTLPAILGTCFFLAAITNVKYFYPFALFIFSSFFWTPFTTVGLSLFCLYFVFKGFQQDKFRFILSVALFGVLLLLAFYPVIVFLLSSDATSMESNLFIWQTGSGTWPLYYLLYLFGFFGIWFIFFRKGLFEFDRELLLVSFLTFALLGLVQMGHFNDLNTRASIAAQLVLGISITYALVVRYRNGRKNNWFIMAALFLAINSLSFVKFYYERLFSLDRGFINTIENPGIPESGDNYYDFLEKGYSNGKEVVQQYSLKKGSIFEKYLLKRNSK
ncbi:hypothetical protein [Dyadobacter frigoris]|uniref:YfhO family protein n=1 Tax=Dyadobacter frigoris TaxID=2576211 RepID=A0A4U6D8J2_9BACT|nr:hypothetical protein [Dyadobacter frigoris]TKT93820.1 hypothetical protein FDK13_00995 [Dyadobacter frigoris]GLU50965.1 hypothetical protein Dfri01_04260 [Dyadobacter frigoris]